MSRSAQLVEAVYAGASRFGDGEIEVLCPPPSTVDAVVGEMTERPVTADQTHESVIVGERFVVKWYRHPPAPHAVAQLARLTSVGFPGCPPTYAVVSTAGATTALVSGYLPGAVDGWDWCLADFDTDFGTHLGLLAADLHLALAVAPAPATAAMRELWQRQSEAALSAVLAEITGPDGEWLASVADRMRADLALPSAVGTPVLAVHGDLHVGQVLKWRPDGGAVAYAVTDFDGNPTATERGPLQPAARDLAQLLTSLDHVAMMVARQAAGAPLDGDPSRPTGDWPTIAPALARAGVLRGQLFQAYTGRLAEAGRSELLDRRLVRAFEVEQECRELLYAARFSPTWRYSGIGALRSRYP